MRRMLAWSLSCGLLFLWAAGCSSSPDAPSGVLDGTWSGAMTGDDSGTVKLMLTQKGAGVAGTFEWRSTDGLQVRSGDAGGTLAGSVLTLAMSGAPLACGNGVTLSGTVSASLSVNGTRMSGSYAGFTCGGAAAGKLDVERQPG